jgi:hypothetical protein
MDIFSYTSFPTFAVELPNIIAKISLAQVF